MTDPRSFMILGHKRPRRPIAWFDEIIRSDTIRPGNVVYLAGRAKLIKDWPHDNVDVTGAFLAATGDVSDVSETYQAMREATR